MEGRERAEYVNRRESCSANKRCIARRKSERKRQRKDGTGGSRGRREIGGRIGWDVQVRQYTKGSPEITIFHSFARSNYFVQLKYRFSPPSPRLSREFAFCSVAHSPSPPFRPSALSSPATLHTVTSTVPNPVILPLHTLARPRIQPPLSLYRSFFPSLSPTVAFSLFLCLHLRYSGFNIQLLATRALVDHSQKAGNEVAYGFCVHTNGRVLFHCPPTTAV